YEKWLASLMLSLDEIFGRRNKFIVACFHPLPVQWSRILNFLPTNFSPPPHYHGIIFACGPRMDNAAGADCFIELGKFSFRRIVVHFRLFFRVKVVKITKELVESMVGRQHVIKIA